MHLYLIRHGQSYVNLSDWQHGNSDEGLTDLGHRQAKATAVLMAERLDAVDAMYASTMRRARETAEPIADRLAAEIVFDDRIREIGNNQLDHAPFPDLPTDYADYWATARPFSSVTPTVDRGESLMHFRTRVGAFVEQLVTEQAGGTVIVVTHGGVVDTIFDHVFNVGPWPNVQVWTHNAAITHLERLEFAPESDWFAHAGPEQWRLHGHNDMAHLRGLESSPAVTDDGIADQ